MKKEDWIFIIILILTVVVFVLGVIRADRICREANPDNYNNYRFCMGI